MAAKVITRKPKGPPDGERCLRLATARRTTGIALVNPFEFAGGSRHWFFVAVGFDQLLHYVTLFVTAGWWLR